MPRKRFPKRVRTIKAHVTEEEFARLKYDAGRFNFTMSDYVRRVMMEFKIPQSVVDAEARLEFLRINADLARLGNLFKMALNEDSFRGSGVGPDQIQKLIKEFEGARQFLLDQIRALSKR